MTTKHSPEILCKLSEYWLSSSGLPFFFLSLVLIFVFNPVAAVDMRRSREPRLPEVPSTVTEGPVRPVTPDTNDIELRLK